MSSITVNKEKMTELLLATPSGHASMFRVFLLILANMDENGCYKVPQIQYADDLKLSRSSLWMHLDRLVKAGFVSVLDPSKRVKTYRINPDLFGYGE